MPAFAGVASSATRPTVSSASSQSPRQNKVRARCSVAPSRLALLATRSAAAIAVLRGLGGLLEPAERR